MNHDFFLYSVISTSGEVLRNFRTVGISFLCATRLGGVVYKNSMIDGLLCRVVVEQKESSFKLQSFPEQPMPTLGVDDLIKTNFGVSL